MILFLKNTKTFGCGGSSWGSVVLWLRSNFLLFAGYEPLQLILSKAASVGSAAAWFPGAAGEQLGKAAQLGLAGTSPLLRTDDWQMGSRERPCEFPEGLQGAFSGTHSSGWGSFSRGEPGSGRQRARW